MKTPAASWRLEASLLSAVAQKHATPVYCIVPSRTSAARRAASTRSRAIHTSPPNAQDAVLSSSPVPPAPTPTASAHSGTTAAKTMPAACACLPLSQVLRTYLITSISSSPFLLGTSTKILRSMLESKSPLFSIDRNPVLRSLLWHTFYRQFCAGETKAQVARVNAELREQGYSGVILEYALEVLKGVPKGKAVDEEKDISTWRKGMLDTVALAAPGDFVGLKWSGMGPAAMRRMKEDVEPSEGMQEAMHALCSAVKAREISLLPAAEETWSLSGFLNWTLRMQRVYNAGLDGKPGAPVVYSTYQAYLKQTPQTISKHLDIARREGFTLGIKLVRGAYLGSEERSLIHPSIEATHAAYDRIAEALIQKRGNDWITSPDSEPGNAGASWPEISVVLATHNAVSVQRAQTLRRQQLSRGEELTKLSFAQLQGMADEVSCTLIAAAKAAEASDGGEKAVRERVYKCTTWGSMSECLNYLLRRAAENKDAAGRTRETRRAMQADLARRMLAVFGLA